VDGDVGSLGYVLAQEPIGVLVGPALPWRASGGEEDGNAGQVGETSVTRHSIPRSQSPIAVVTTAESRSPRSDQSGDHAVGAGSVGQVQQNEVTTRALDKCADVGPALAAHDEVAFPVADLGSWSGTPAML